MNQQLQTDVSLKPYNTFAIDVKASYLVEVNSEAELKDVLKLPNIKQHEKLFLGGGSNILLTRDVKGVVIHLNLKGVEVIEETSEFVELAVAAGENWHQLVMYCVEQGWGGVENLAFIPGSVGATPVQNIGAYGVEVKQTITKVEALDANSLEAKTFTNAECHFGYRDSIFKREAKGKYIITRVYFRLQKAPHQLNTSYGAIEELLKQTGKAEADWTIKDVCAAVIQIRKTKLPDPAVVGTAGSFFKNPIVVAEKLAELQKTYPNIPFYNEAGGLIKIPAGWLIDTAGWKGWTDETGRYGVHKDHALVLVNYQAGTGAEIWQLAQRIQADINTKFGIAIEPEVNVY